MEDKKGQRKRNISIGQLILGLIIIFVGVLLLLETTDLAETRHILRFFPSVLILLGIWALVKNRLQSFFGPVLLILIGLAWQLVALNYLTVGRVFDFWPIILIILGIYLIIGRYRSRVRESSSEYISTFAVFGDVEKRNISKNFTGGDMTGIFSDILLDLRDIEIEDRPARINSACIFSDANIIVSNDLNVKIEVLPLLADALDKRPKSKDEHDEVDLVVSGWALFSDICIRD